MAPDLPRLPTPRQRNTADKDAATFAALIGICLVGFAFLGIASLVLPQVRGLVLVFGGGVMFFAIHYVVWGRLLTRLRNEQREAEQGRNNDQ
ncbi:MAG: hypothetical protein KF861_10305 [Planctomycetaceae bacterium]|nr:hypothetical protein [Planctomycetaceae bacterium]